MTTATFKLVETPGNQRLDDVSLAEIDPRQRAAAAALSVGESVTVPAIDGDAVMDDLGVRITRLA